MAATFISLLTLLTVTLVSAESFVTSLFIPDVEGTALVASIISQVRPPVLIHTASTHLVGYNRVPVRRLIVSIAHLVQTVRTVACRPV